MTKMKPSGRRKAREFTLQALYQWDVSGESLTEIELQFHSIHRMTNVDTDFFSELLHQIPAKISELDKIFKSHLDRSIADITPIELIILRMGTYELSKRPDVPYRVVINECLELAKKFGTEDGFKYVNGVLDKVARDQRSAEIASKS